jgi:hypothetical protein
MNRRAAFELIILSAVLVGCGGRYVEYRDSGGSGGVAGVGGVLGVSTVPSGAGMSVGSAVGGGDTAVTSAAAPCGAFQSGGQVNPCKGSPPGVGCQAFDLIAAHWALEADPSRGCSNLEELSPLTGRGLARGFLTTSGWNGRLVESADALNVYAVGADANGSPQLLSVSMQDGAESSAPVAQPFYTLAGVLGSGMVVGVYFPLEKDARVDAIDPKTGSATDLGSIAGLRLWTDQTVLSRATGKLLASGSTSGTGPKFLYTFDLANGSTSTLTLPSDLLLGGTTIDGQAIIAATYDANGWFVESIDSKSGVATKFGALGDFAAVSGSGMTYDWTTNTAYVLGEAMNLLSLYELQLATATFRQVTLSSEIALAQQ